MKDVAAVPDSEIMLTSGSDTVPENISTPFSVAVGASVTGYINNSADEDWFSVTLEAGQSYQFTLNGSGASPLSDPLIRLYNASGNQIASNDDGGPGLNSLLNFTATTSGTYYIAADAWSSETGRYTLSVNAVAPPTPSSPLDSIDWGTAVTPASNVINVYFAANGQTFDGVTSQGWSRAG
ncbi:MAG: PPC domain-containing protein [Proteobacteria bacterium]|nr:PPC domain-containing protein [Pseudomonadota bacterium]